MKQCFGDSNGTGGPVIFRQLFCRDSCTYTYLLACPDSMEAILLDPVRGCIDRDLQLLQELGLT